MEQDNIIIKEINGQSVKFIKRPENDQGDPYYMDSFTYGVKKEENMKNQREIKYE